MKYILILIFSFALSIQLAAQQEITMQYDSIAG